MNELTVNDYLDNLELDRQDMINSLKSKGMEISDSATFTEIVPKIDGLVDINEYYYLNKKTSGKFSSYIKQIPIVDTSDYTQMNYMFSGYSSLTAIPQLDTTKVVNMNHLFSECSSLISIPLLNTSNVTNMGAMFSECRALTTIPLLNTSNVTDMGSMFSYSTSLTTIPQLDTSKVTSMGYMFFNCISLTTIPKLDTSKVTNISNIVSGCRTLTTLGGFTNLGQAYSTTANASYGNYVLSLSSSSNITYESLMNVINNLYDIAAKGCKPQKLILGTTNLSKLTEEEIAIATNKGWTVS